MSTAGADVRAVILKQDLPHLSHLGVRARQERVPFATCTSADAIARDFSALVGSAVNVSVTADGVRVEQVTDEELLSANAKGASAAAAAAASGAHASATRAKRASVEKLAKAGAETCGAKAAACAALATLTSSVGKSAGTSSFRAPAGAVLPFGCMEAAVSKSGRQKKFEGLLQKLESCAAGPALDDACAEVQHLLMQECKPPADLMQKLQAELRDARIVIARSSANVEDLAGLSGAGLYDSIPNIEASSAEALAEGIAAVWASLFSRRAVLSRRAAGIAQADACMAVLVQVCPLPCAPVDAAVLAL